MASAKIKQNIHDLFVQHISTILDDIADTYKIDVNELKSKYLEDNASTTTDASAVVVTEKKKRGRKKKQKDEFIETVEVEYEGEKYLVDDNNNVYSHNVEEPRLIGERLVDGTIRRLQET